jgi:signal transduction histidine kinase
MLAEASRLFNTSLKVRDVVPNVVTVATNMLANTAVVYILRENTDQLHPIGYISQLPQPPGMPEYSAVKHGKPIKVGQTAIGKVVQTGTPILLRESDLKRTPLFLRAEDGVESFLCVPLRVRGRIIGALVCYNVTFHQIIQVVTMEERHVAVAQALADRAAIAIENAQMYEAEIREQSSKDEFLSLVAHELRTPITSIKGYNRLIIKRLEETDGLEPGQYNLMDSLRHYTGAMDTQVERLHVLIEDLTRISEIETDRVELHKRPAELVTLVRNKVAEMEKQLKAARLPRVMHSFEIRAYPDLITAEVDIAAFERVVFSILSNAVKFSPKGGIIKIRIQQALDEVTVSVQDEGVGISPDDRLKIFERFYKSTNHGSRANGLGLGLYISQGLMKAMGGRIEVESEEGNGSTFTIFVRK